ncbi:hypothetical protein MMC31_004126 [Peltigera leucophlebia]|nr:hypothetical protein [Peltigera leucophlebia]
MAHPMISAASSTLLSAPSKASLFRDVAESLAQYLPQHEGDKTRLILESSFNLRDLANQLIFHILADDFKSLAIVELDAVLQAQDICEA